MSQERVGTQMLIDQLYRGRLPAAERALNVALLALKRRKDPRVALRQSAEVLRAAHWMPAVRWNEALVSAWSHIIKTHKATLPSDGETDPAIEPAAHLQQQDSDSRAESAVISADDAHLESSALDAATEQPIDKDISATPSAHAAQNESNESRPSRASSSFPAEEEVAPFRSALASFLDAVQHAPLREFAWFSDLAEHYHTLSAYQSKSVAVFIEECATAGHILPSAFFYTSHADSELLVALTALRARYERALLALLNTSNETEVSLEEAALDELDACLSALIALEPSRAHPNVYDIGRLVHTWMHIRRQILQPHAQHAFAAILDKQVRRVYALLNPLWIMAALKASASTHEKGQKERVFQVPPACIQALVISLWGMVLAYRASTECTKTDLQEYAGLLADYGIVFSTVTEPSASETKDSLSDVLALWELAGFSETQHLGGLALSQDAYEYFQAQLKQGSTALTEAIQVVSAKKQVPGPALSVAEEVNGLAYLAYTIGLGSLAFFAGQLSLVWRYYAYQIFQMRSEKLIQQSLQASDSDDVRPLLDKAAEILSIRQSTVEHTQTALLEITHALLNVLEASDLLEDGDISSTVADSLAVCQGILITMQDQQH